MKLYCADRLPTTLTQNVRKVSSNCIFNDQWGLTVIFYNFLSYGLTERQIDQSENGITIKQNSPLTKSLANSN